MLNGKHERGFAGVLLLQVQAWVGEWYEQSNDRNAANVEQQNANVDAADGLGDVTSWVLGLAGSDLSQ